MKTIEEILKDNYVIENNEKKYTFNNKTPKKTALKLIELHQSRQRIILDYGDIKTNGSWNEDFDITGRVGVTGGNYGLCYPILVYNKRSIGGGLILTDCIIEIKTSKGKKSIYKNQC